MIIYEIRSSVLSLREYRLTYILRQVSSVCSCAGINVRQVKLPGGLYRFWYEFPAWLRDNLITIIIVALIDQRWHACYALGITAAM